jgi:hypothetical protein
LALSVGNGSYPSLLHKKRGEITPLISNFNLTRKQGIICLISQHKILYISILVVFGIHTTIMIEMIEVCAVVFYDTIDKA